MATRIPSGAHPNEQTTYVQQTMAPISFANNGAPFTWHRQST